MTAATSLSQRLLRPYPDVPLTLAEGGRGRPVLILHGGTGPASVTGLAAHLAPTHHVLAPTHPGWEDTPRPGWFTGADNLVETYLDLLDDLGLEDVTVIGSSFGGWLAAEMAVRDRGRAVTALVLIDAIGPLIDGHPLRVPGPGAPGPGTGTPRGGPPPGAMAALRAYAGESFGDPKLLPRLTRIKVPALVIWGELDTVATLAYGRHYAAAIPTVRLETIDDAGHVPTREKPEEVYAIIDAFLGETGP